jgi:hypothetical protein
LVLHSEDIREEKLPREISETPGGRRQITMKYFKISSSPNNFMATKLRQVRRAGKIGLIKYA